MRHLTSAALVATGLALTPFVAFAQESGEPEAERSAQSRPDAQVAAVQSLTEIASLAVVTLRRPAQAQEDDEGAAAEPAQMAQDDLLLSGVGERTILTSEDIDTETASPADEDAQAASSEADLDSDADAAANTQPSPLRTAVAQNAVLSGALRERNVDIGDVVGVEVRGDGVVIVYTDES